MTWVPKLAATASSKSIFNLRYFCYLINEFRIEDTHLVTSCEDNTVYVWKMFQHAPEVDYTLRHKKGPWFSSLVIPHKTHGHVILIGDAKRYLN